MYILFYSASLLDMAMAGRWLAGGNYLLCNVLTITVLEWAEQNLKPQAN